MCHDCRVLGTFVNYAVAMSLMKNERDVLLSPNGNGVFTGVHFLSFETEAIRYGPLRPPRHEYTGLMPFIQSSWGVFAQRLYMPGKQYVSETPDRTGFKGVDLIDMIS